MTPLLWTLIALQVAMGAFDTLYHHELTERLPWRREQARELRLHGVRNLIYAVLFAGFGLLRPQGLFAAAILVLLATELLITLWDFVEEDRTRALPATERVTHTLLALNYGAILTLLVPLLLAWAAAPTALPRAEHGLWGAFMVLSALGVALFGLRDLAASARLRRIAPRPAADLFAGPRGAYLVTGGTGFVGTRLTQAMAAAGHRVTVLSRRAGTRVPPGVRLVTSLDQIAPDEAFGAVISLAGAPIAVPWTPAARRRILASRTRTARALGRLLARLDAPPPVLVAASAVGAYGLRGDRPVTEAEPIRRDGSFSQRSCEATERAYERLRTPRTRVVHLRIGLVLGTEGGLLARMLLPFEFGLGGPVGTGRQWMSWIGRDDLVRLIAHVVRTPSLDGPVNAVTPHPVRAEVLARTLAGALHRPCRLRVPRVAVRALGGMGRELLLGGQCVVPAKALGSGFAFDDPALAPLLRRIVGSAGPAEAEAPALAPAPARPRLVAA